MTNYNTNDDLGCLNSKSTSFNTKEESFNTKDDLGCLNFKSKLIACSKESQSHSTMAQFAPLNTSNS